MLPTYTGNADHVPRNGTLKGTRGQKNRTSFPLNGHRMDSSAWSPYILGRRNGIRFCWRKVSHLSNPLFQRGNREKQCEGFQFLRQACLWLANVLLFDKCTIGYRRKQLDTYFLTFILKHTNTCSQPDICARIASTTRLKVTHQSVSQVFPVDIYIRPEASRDSRRCGIVWLKLLLFVTERIIKNTRRASMHSQYG